MNLTEAFEVLLKGRKMDVGAITTRANGVQYQKQGDGKWVEYRGVAKKQGAGESEPKKQTSTKDLKGNEKEDYMYAVGDFSAYKPVEDAKKIKLDIGEFYIVKKYTGYSISDPVYGLELSSSKTKSGAIAEANEKISSTKTGDMQKLKEFAEKNMRGAQERAIRIANNYDSFLDVVKAGRMTYKDAISILQSANIEPSADLKEFGNQKESNYSKDYKKSEIITSSKLNKKQIHKYMAVAGVPKGYKGDVYFTENEGSVSVRISDNDIYMKRNIFTEGDSVGVIENESFNIKNKGKYNGTDLFNNQIQNAQKEGFSKIITEAYRSQGWNGYYTWLRLGYKPDGDTNEKYVDIANKELGADITSVRDLMYSQEGRDWWKENGGTFQGSFYLSKNSYSMKTLEEYIKNKNK